MREYLLFHECSFVCFGHCVYVVLYPLIILDILFLGEWGAQKVTESSGCTGGFGQLVMEGGGTWTFCLGRIPNVSVLLSSWSNLSIEEGVHFLSIREIQLFSLTVVAGSWGGWVEEARGPYYPVSRDLFKGRIFCLLPSIALIWCEVLSPIFYPHIL